MVAANGFSSARKPEHSRHRTYYPNINSVKPLPTLFKMKRVGIFAISLVGAAVGVAGAATTTFPKASGETALPTAMVVSGSFDGGMKRYNRNRERIVNSRLCTRAYVIYCSRHLQGPDRDGRSRGHVHRRGRGKHLQRCHWQGSRRRHSLPRCLVSTPYRGPFPAHPMAPSR